MKARAVKAGYATNADRGLRGSTSEPAPTAPRAVQEAHAIAELVDGASLAMGRRVAPVGVVVVGEPEQLGAQLGSDRADHGQAGEDPGNWPYLAI